MGSPSKELSDWASLCANVVTSLSIAGAIWILAQFFIDRKRERQQREISTYLALNASYIDFLRRCLDDPGLATVKPVEAETLDRRQSIHMAMVVSMLEAAYFMYRDQDTAFRKAQWSGWNDYIRAWCQHPEFRNRWPEVIEQYDSEFKSHVEQVYNEPQRSA